MTRGTYTVVTGATGWLGSHLSAEMLRRDPAAFLVCIAREGQGRSAYDRVMESLELARRDHGDDYALPQTWIDRLVVLPESGPEDEDTSERISAEVGDRTSAEFWHCAASTRFMALRSSLWESNVEGTRSALRLSDNLRCQTFNYVSSAYVAGTLEGYISAQLHPVDTEYNNCYEETKAQAEHDVAGHYAMQGGRYRIFRPSVIISHSQTFLGSRPTPVTKLVRLLSAFLQAHGADRFTTTQPLRIRLRRDATLDLIPVDLCVYEMLAIAEHTDSCGEIYHITSQSPVSVRDLVEAIMVQVGLTNWQCVERQHELSRYDRQLDRRLADYRSYLNTRKIFDRASVLRLNAGERQAEYLLDVGRMKAFLVEALKPKESPVAGLTNAAL